MIFQPMFCLACHRLCYTNINKAVIKLNMNTNGKL